jgi:hypothetical protein
MPPPRTCKARTARNQPCGAAPLHGSDYCVFHDPEYSKTVQAARSAGGQRRKREVALAVAYDFQGLGSVAEIRRLVEVAAFDALGLDSSIQRVRALAYLAQVSVGLLEKGEWEQRLEAVEEAVGVSAVPPARRRMG